MDGQPHLDHEPRPECAELFRDLAVKIEAGRGKSDRVDGLDAAVDLLRADVTSDVKELTKTITGYHTDLVKDMATTKASARSAHKRIDTLRNIGSSIAAAMLTIALTVAGWFATR